MRVPYRRRFRLLIYLAALLPALACSSEPNAGADHGVILTYHHVAADTPASTSITPAEFAAHVEYLASNNYQILPLSELVTGLRSGRPVPDKAVAITFDDAYRSVFATARPLLRDRGWPYTVFVSTKSIAAGHAPYMTWQELNQLADEGVEIGNHSHSHTHLVARHAGEDKNTWLLRVRADIEQAQSQIAAQLGTRPTLFAYPYGEYTRALASLVAELDLIGFGQHSGPIGHTSDFSALPRFPAGGAYTAVSRLAERVDTEPLPVKALPPGPLVLQPHDDRPTLTLSVADGPYDLGQLACYASGQGRMHLTEQTPGQIVIQPAAKLAVGRSKFNCTAPHQVRGGVYFWWSYLLMKPPSPNTWYDG